MLFNYTVSFQQKVKGSRRLSSVFITFLLCLFTSIVIPAHYHNDGQLHDDCLICTDQSMPCQYEQVFDLPPVLFLNIGTTSFYCQSFTKVFQSRFNSRAPPSTNPIS